MNEPKAGSKPSPITPEEGAAIASAKAHRDDMTLLRYLSLARSVGVRRVRMSFKGDGVALELGALGGYAALDDRALCSLTLSRDALTID